MLQILKILNDIRRGLKQYKGGNTWKVEPNQTEPSSLAHTGPESARFGPRFWPGP